MDKILVTGAVGQIGSELTVALRERYGSDRVIAAGHRTPPSKALRNSGPFVTVDVTDKVANLTASPPFTVVRDTTPPTATIYVPPTSGIAIPVSWNGSVDDESGIRSYEVEYKEEGGAWTAWLTETTTSDFRFWIYDLRLVGYNPKSAIQNRKSAAPP